MRGSTRISTATLFRLIALVRPHRAAFSGALVALGAGSAINLLFPEIIRRLIDGPWAGVIAEHHLFVAAALIGLFALQGICFYARSWLFGLIGQRVVADLRGSAFGAVIRQPVAFFDARRTGDLVSRLHADTQLLQDAVSIRLSVVVRYALQVGAGIVLMFLLSPRLTVAIILLLPVLVGISLFLGRRLRTLSKAQQGAVGEASAFAEESFGGARIIKSFGRDDFQAGQYSALNDVVLDLGLRRTRVSAFFSSFVSFLLNGCIVLVLLYGITLVSAGSLSTGDLVAFLLYGSIVAVSFAILAGAWGELAQAAGGAERVFELLDGATPSPGQALRAPIDVTWSGGIEFRGVHFRYPTRPELPVFAGLSLSLAPGRTTALVGPSGAGKSTIVQLILGLYEIEGGTILAGSQDLARIDLQTLRERIALVPQEPLLFATSVAANLRFARPEATTAELEAACDEAGILQFIRSLPEQFDTRVGERGTQLSAGQRQRVAIARALLRNPALLILDEATSALDSESERLVQEALDRLLPGRTALIIAHRLSTVRHADHLLVLDRGRIVQEGTHDTLSRSEGIYRTLVSRQELQP